MERVVPRPAKVEIGFTEDRLTGTGGAALLAEAARRFGLADRLADAVSVKRRNRGASDAETQWSVVASLAAGNGSLSDLDALREDGVQRELLGLSSAPSSRRAGEFLSRLAKRDVERLHGVSRHLAQCLAPDVVARELAEKGCVAVFVDGTGIEVKRDVAPLLPKGTPVWVHCDAAYYRRGFVEFARGRGWDVSVSVTDPNKSRPILDVVEGLPEHGWEDIGGGESATWVQGHENAFKGPLVELDLHHPPCRGYRANQAFYAYGQMAHLLLCAVQYRLLPESARRHGIRPLVRHVMRTVARLVRSGRRLSLLFASCCLRRDWLLYAGIRLRIDSG